MLVWNVTNKGAWMALSNDLGSSEPSVSFFWEL